MQLTFKQLGGYLNSTAWFMKSVSNIWTEKDTDMK
jgi:hypothetical protein